MSITSQDVSSAPPATSSKAERDARIATAAGHLDAGRYGEAASECRRILAANAADAEALCFLGMARCNGGDEAAGLEAFAITETAGMRTNYGSTLKKLGLLADPSACVGCGGQRRSGRPSPRTLTRRFFEQNPSQN